MRYNFAGAVKKWYGEESREMWEKLRDVVDKTWLLVDAEKKSVAAKLEKAINWLAGLVKDGIDSFVRQMNKIDELGNAAIAVGWSYFTPRPEYDKIKKDVESGAIDKEYDANNWKDFVAEVEKTWAYVQDEKKPNVVAFLEAAIGYIRDFEKNGNMLRVQTKKMVIKDKNELGNKALGYRWSSHPDYTAMTKDNLKIAKEKYNNKSVQPWETLVKAVDALWPRVEEVIKKADGK